MTGRVRDQRLMDLHPEGRRLVTSELMSGQRAFWPELAYAEIVKPVEPIVRLGRLDDDIDALLATTPRRSAAFDRDAAPLIHRHLPLPRRLATEPGLWRFLTVVHRPDVVRHRWEVRSQRQMAARFWQVGTRPESNVFARLWWVAELTRQGDDYSLTERLLAHPALTTALFVRELGWYRPLVAACVDVLGDQPAATIDVTIRSLRAALSVVVLESCDEATLRRMLEDELR